MSCKWTQCERDARGAEGNAPTEEPPLLTVADVAKLLAVPKSTVYRLVRRRQLETVRLGRYFRFQRSAVRDCINNGRWIHD
ncbi:MAG: Helix-turn-helix domain protein [Nitrospira sp. OLB3]|nr:MAG: Helix-turn-helix domain protein [Nitrospira sp. OLB3]